MKTRQTKLKYQEVVEERAGSIPLRRDRAAALHPSGGDERVAVVNEENEGRRSVDGRCS